MAISATTKKKQFFWSFLVMAFVFIGLGTYARVKHANLVSEGLAKPGVITNAEVTRGSKNKKNYFLNVTWDDGATKHENQKFRVKGSFFDDVVVDGRVAKTDVLVRYYPDKTDEAIIDGGVSDLSGMEILGALIAIPLLFFKGLSWLKSRKSPAVDPVV